MMHKTHTLALIISLAFVFTVNSSINAQNLNVKLLCSPRQDSILLRWGPINSETWRLGNQYGYIVKRFTVLKDKKIPKEIVGVALTEEALKPAPIDTWEKSADDKYVSIAAECIYGSFYKGIPTAGNPHIAYEKYKEEKHRFSFALYAADQSIVAAKLSGLYFADKTAQANEKYLYRVYINCPDSIRIDTAYAFTGLSEYQSLPKPIEIKAEWTDKEVTLSWNIQYLKHIYNSYVVEKSLDKGKSYNTISDNATVQVADKEVSPNYMYKTDSLSDNNSIIYYRVKGISAFGETGPASDSVFGKGMLPITTAPMIVSNNTINNELIELKWEYPQEMEPYISGFKIYRSPKPEGRKKIVYMGTDPLQREFIDSTPNITNYYLISVYNAQKEKLSSIKTYSELVDSFPPVPPVHIAGMIDSSGRVKVSWTPNTDEDIHGYRVYMSNNPKFEFMLVTSSLLTDTVYTDSINIKTLTKNIYYKVKAVDVRENQSNFSEMLTLSRPDIIPPVSPVIKNITDQNGFPELNWVNSSSKDVIFHRIYRKAKEDSVFQQIKQLEKVSDTKSAYIDKEVSAGKEYIYYVLAVDDSKLQSPPSNTGYFKVSSGIIESIKLKKRVQTDQVKLFWSIKAEKQISRILVYRSVNEEAMRLYGNSEEETFTDKNLSLGKTYKYAIQAIYSDGSSSSISNPIIVKM